MPTDPAPRLPPWLQRCSPKLPCSAAPLPFSAWQSPTRSVCLPPLCAPALLQVGGTVQAGQLNLRLMDCGMVHLVDEPVPPNLRWAFGRAWGRQRSRGSPRSPCLQAVCSAGPSRVPGMLLLTGSRAWSMAATSSTCTGCGHATPHVLVACRGSLLGCSRLSPPAPSGASLPDASQLLAAPLPCPVPRCAGNVLAKTLEEERGGVHANTDLFGLGNMCIALMGDKAAECCEWPARIPFGGMRFLGRLTSRRCCCASAMLCPPLLLCARWCQHSWWHAPTPLRSPHCAAK